MADGTLSQINGPLGQIKGTLGQIDSTLGQVDGSLGPINRIRWIDRPSGSTSSELRQTRK